MSNKRPAHILLTDSSDHEQFLGVIILDISLEEWEMVLARGINRFSRIGTFQTIDQLVAHAAFLLGTDVVATAVPSTSDDPFGQISNDMMQELLETNKCMVDHRYMHLSDRHAFDNLWVQMSQGVQLSQANYYARQGD